MASTQIPRLVRMGAAKGMAGGKMPSVRMVGGGGKMAGGGKAGGGGGAGKETGGAGSNPIGQAFDTEGGTYDSANATTRGGYIGPFSWGGDLTEGAKRVRQKLSDQDKTLQGHMDNLQNALQQNGGDMRGALASLWKTDPGALKALVGGGMMSKNGIGALLGRTQKDYTLGPNSQRMSGADNSVIAQGQQVGNQTAKPMKDANGNIVMVNPGAGTATPVTGPNGEPMPGKAAPPQKDVAPGKIENVDRQYFSTVSNAIDALKSFKQYADATGPITGNLKKWAGEYFGMSDTGQALGALSDRLEQAGMVMSKSNYSGAFKQWAATLPSAGKGGTFNTTLINGMLEDMTNQLQDRAGTTEFNTTKGGAARVGGQPAGQLPPEVTHDLNRADVYTQAQAKNGEASPTWKMRNAPDTLSASELEQLYTQRQDLLPQQQNLPEQLILARAAKEKAALGGNSQIPQQQPQQPVGPTQETQQVPGQQPAAQPPAPQATQGGPPPAPAPAQAQAPPPRAAPSPYVGQAAGEEDEEE